MNDMIPTKRYKLYVKNHIKKYGSRHHCYSFEKWKARCQRVNKNRSQCLYGVADFETTYAGQTLPSGNDIMLDYQSEMNILNDAPKASRVFLAGLKMFNRQPLISYEELDIFFNNIMRECQACKKSKAKIWFHNLKYDGSYLLNHLLRQGWSQTLEQNKWKQPILQHKEFALLVSEGKWFFLKLKWKNIKIEFYDGLKLQPFALKKLGELYNIPKLSGNVDYRDFKIYPKHDYPQLWIDYLINDLRITEAYMLSFKARGDINNLTIGTLAFKKIRKLINIHTHCNVKQFDYWNKYYRGGCCQVAKNKMGQWVYAPKQIQMIDAVSMYPTIMVDWLPSGRKLNHKPKGRSIEYLEVEVYDFKLKPKQTLICFPKPTFWDGTQQASLKIHQGTTYLEEMHCQGINQGIPFTYYFVKDEFEMLCKIYDVSYDITRRYYFQAKKYLQKIIKQLFKNKQKATNLIDRQYHKLVINNLYGKTGQHYEAPFDFYGNEFDKVKYDIKHERNQVFTIAHKKALTLYEKKEPDDIAKPVYLAAYITAMARVKLLKQYLHVLSYKGHFLYCDTDSITFIKPKRQIPFAIGNNLGQWEYEKFKVGDGFVALCPKQYRVCEIGNQLPIKYSCAGVSREKMGSIKNKDYNYQLAIDKLSNVNSQYGFQLIPVEFNFQKYNHIKMNRIPKEFK